MGRTLMMGILFFSLWGEAKTEVIYSDLRLLASELIDDMVYSWLKEPPVAANMSIVLADISAPVGVDARFNDLIENRLYELFSKNPDLSLKLVHCSACQQWVTITNPHRTILQRGVDQPEALKGFLLLSPNALALSLQFEAREREIILLAHIFELTGSQKIVWAKRFSTHMGLRQTLREANPLLSLNEARQIQNQILEGREPMKLVSRFHVHNFQSQSKLGAIPPLLFAEQSVEGEVLPWRKQRLGLSVGMTSIKDSLSGWSLGGHYSQLMFRETPSLIYPDLYWFFGLNYMRLTGLGAAVFGEDQIDLAKLLKENEDPKTSHTIYQIGFEVFIKHRFGMNVYVEYFPALKNSKVIQEQSFIFPYHALGTGMVFQW